MMKRILTVFIAVILALGWPALGLAQDERITITTYYPPNEGTYNNLYALGNLGVGTTHPGSAGLNRDGATYLDISGNPAYLRLIDSTDGNDSFLQFLDNNYNVLYQIRPQSPNYLGFFSPQNYNWVFENGRVGIGTTSPGQNLEINTVANATDSAIVRTSSRDTNFSGMQLYSYNANGDYRGGWAIVKNGVGALEINRDASAENMASENAITIKNDATVNVGIGTTSPGQNLEINTVANATDSAIVRTSSRDTEFSGMQLYSYNVAGNYSGGWAIVKNGAGALEINRDASAENMASESAIYIKNDTTVNVGIGTSTPSEKLEVNGYIQAKGIILSNVQTGTFTYPPAKETHDDNDGCVTFNTTAKQTFADPFPNGIVPAFEQLDGNDFTMSGSPDGYQSCSPLGSSYSFTNKNNTSFKFFARFRCTKKTGLCVMNPNFFTITYTASGSKIY